MICLLHHAAVLIIDKSLKTNSPETKRNKKGLEVQQNKIDEKGQSIKEARWQIKECKDYKKLSVLKECSPHQLAVFSNRTV